MTDFDTLTVMCNATATPTNVHEDQAARLQPVARSACLWQAYGKGPGCSRSWPISITPEG